MGKKILVVDDSRTVRQQVGSILTEAGYEVVEASDGVEGVETIAATPDLSLVICDVNMPKLSGVDMLAQVKQDPKHAGLQVLMLTTEGQPALVARAKAAGARGWIVKPFKPDQLIAAVRKVVGQ